MKYNIPEFLIFVNLTVEDKLLSFMFRNWIPIHLNTGHVVHYKRIIGTCLIDFQFASVNIKHLLYNQYYERHPSWKKQLHLTKHEFKHSILKSMTLSSGRFAQPFPLWSIFWLHYTPCLLPVLQTTLYWLSFHLMVFDQSSQ